jgi:hypothetical protein
LQKVMVKTPPPNGTVFKYCYLWVWQSKRGMLQSKDRVCRLAFVWNRPNGKDGLAILPISDLAGDDPSKFITIPPQEIKRAGLQTGRPAFIHIDEYNYDEFPTSYYYQSNQKPLGKFSEGFTKALVNSMMQRLKLHQMKQVDRTEQR